MQRCYEEKPYELYSLMVIMDCRVKPGNDAELVSL